jgi:lipopolysaccharide/colanic/teichoic acid biosynthesis glycosyltransferase
MEELTRGTTEPTYHRPVEPRTTRLPTPPRRFIRQETPESVEVRDLVRTAETTRQPERRLAVDDVMPRETPELLSRVINCTLASLGLLVALPFCVVIAMLIKLTSKGPILYAQTRVGRDRRWRPALALHERRVEDLGGQVFTIYKFRTMRVDAERLSGAVWAMENDPRVLRVGRVLRISRLDELPQLWNIIRGDMNIVGPRPERPSIVARLRELIPEYRFRHRVKPGLTGLAQINQNYDTNLEDVRSKIGWDLRYIRQRGIFLDFQIICRTIPTILLKYRGW